MGSEKAAHGLPLVAGDLACELGVWLDSGVRNTPRGELVWNGLRGRIYTASVSGGAVVATVRRAPHSPQWVVSMPGFVWDVTGERGSTTHKYLNIKSSPARGFKSSKEGRAAVEAAFRALLAGVAASAPTSKQSPTNDGRAS